MLLFKEVGLGCVAATLLVSVCASAEVVTITATGQVTQITDLAPAVPGPAPATSSFGVGSALSWTISERSRGLRSMEQAARVVALETAITTSL